VETKHKAMIVKPQDLRLGNLILHELFGAVEVIAIYKNSYDVTRDGKTKEWFTGLGCKGIALTEEWMLKAGFEIRESLSYKEYFIGTNEITHDWLFSLTWIKNPERIDAINAPFYNNGRHTVQYVHQLQNIYFALTGKELEFKL